MKEHSQKYLRQRKFYTLLPVIVFPFLTLLFWLLGGGGTGKEVVTTKSGLNTQLPDANLKSQSALDKLSFYAMADRDSVKREEHVRMDPNYQTTQELDVVSADEKLNRQVEKLQKQVDRTDYSDRPVSKPVEERSDELDRLQMMVQSINQKKADPDIAALNGTLDKLLEMQNPKSIKKDIPENTKRQLFAVRALGSSDERNYFGNGSGRSLREFLSDRDESKDSVHGGTILAVVHSEQILLTGSVVKMRLIQDVFVNGERIPSGSFVFGQSSMNNERLQVVISSIQYQHRLFPVALRVYDMDGLEGIRIPGSVGREVIKQSAEQGIQSVGGLPFDPTLKTQVAAAGVNAAKSLLGKKIKAERVTIKAGYQVLLKDENEKSN